MNMTVEEALRQLVDRAAMLRFFADSAAATNGGETPAPEVFSGIADTCGEIERITRAIRRALSGEALDAELKRESR
jgi:hypothetical protein